MPACTRARASASVRHAENVVFASLASAGRACIMSTLRSPGGGRQVSSNGRGFLRVRLGVVVVAATALAAACSSGSGSKGTTATTSGSTGVTSGATTTAAPSSNPNGILKYGYDFSAQFSNIDPGKSQSPCSAIVTRPSSTRSSMRTSTATSSPGWRRAGRPRSTRTRSRSTFAQVSPSPTVRPLTPTR